ncbi:MAG TPA: hypothetical protein VF510_16425 [Ktedonobacterales bacterium]
MTIEQYLNNMQASFSPELTRGKQAILQYNFVGSQIGSCYAIVEDGTLSLGMGIHPAPTTAVTTDFDLWMRVMSYQEDPLLAYQDGRYSVTGDIETLLESDSWFPRPQVL